MPKCCMGITSKNKICKKRSKYDGYCGFHMYQKTIDFYNPPDKSWPCIEVINISTERLPTIELVMENLRVLFLEMQFHSNLFIYSQYQMECARKNCLILTIELIKTNKHVCYGVRYIDELVESCVKMLRNYPELIDYAEDFKKKCLKSYREQAKKQIIGFYFKHIDGLCADVIEKIMEYI